MEKYSLQEEVQINGHLFLMGERVTFDPVLGVLTFLNKGQKFFGYKWKGELVAFVDDTCCKTVGIPTQLDPSMFLGSTITAVNGMKEGSTKVEITTTSGKLTMQHIRNCCEQVELVDVCGDPKHLIGGIIGVFEVRSGTLGKTKALTHKSKLTAAEVFARRKYTFYEIRTSKGDATLRWGEPDNHTGNNYGEEITLSVD